MARLQIGIALCFLAIVCLTSLAQSKEDNLSEQHVAYSRLPTEPNCGEDLECYVNFALQYYQFVRNHPPSPYTVLAANFGGQHYANIAELFQVLATNPDTAKPAVAKYYAQYSRDALRIKANQYASLAQELSEHTKKYGYLTDELFRSASKNEDSNRVIWFLVVGGLSIIAIMMFYFKANTLRQAQRAYQELINIKGSESWSLDAVNFRIHRLERTLKPDYGGEIKLLLTDPEKRYEIEDTIFPLKQTAERKRRDDTPPDTIIGFERE